MKKDNKQRLFEVMGKLDETFNSNGNTYQSIISNFPGHAKETNPIDSPQYKWYESVMKFMNGNSTHNNVYQKAELAKFFQNNFLGMDYDPLQTPAETVNWWFSPEHQEFIKGELNSNLNEGFNSQEFQQKINNGEVWEEYYAPSASEEYTDGRFFYNRSGQQLRNPKEYDPNGEGYTPFGDEG